jgi:ferrous iron transport protein B
MSCHTKKAASKFENNKNGKGNNGKPLKHLTIALAGNANVGKSVIFNQLTGSNQIIGNWPGKTVDRAEGTLRFEDYDITVIDLPGIYSFSTFSMEELVSRDYIALEKPDVVINVLDAAILERNLFFTIQLIEMEVPLVVCLNQIDEAKKRGMIIDKEKLEQALGVPVMLTVATRGEGVYELVTKAVQVATSKPQKKEIKYKQEVETSVEELSRLIETENLELKYPPRWIAIKLLEGDSEIKKLVASKSQKVADVAEISGQNLSNSCHEPCFSIIASERYTLASSIASRAVTQTLVKRSFSERLDAVTTHRVFGYFTSAGVVVGLLLWTFVVGNFISGLISNAFNSVAPLDPAVNGPIVSVLLNGIIGGLVAGLTLVIPYVIPFYLLLAAIEDSGILTRVAFMMDSAMHKIGLHGKALIPLILGYGCNVPAIQSCKIMETRRERLLAAFAITFAPCTARTLVIFGLVGAFLGVQWALALYVVNVAIIFLLGRVAMKAVPGKSTGLIMEMHGFKVPSLKVITRQTWGRTKSIIYMVFPIYIIGSAAVQALYALNLLTPISNALSPLTVWWLGLPLAAGILLILGTVRKEFVLLGAVAIVGSTNLALMFSPIQFVVMALVAMLYLPCVSTVAILGKEFGWKAAATISLANILSALLIGGLAYRLLSLFM